MVPKRIIILLTFLLFPLLAFSQNWDYLDVAPGFETLNLAVDGDTTASGEPVSLNRAYRLERGGVYLLNGDVGNVKGAPLRIVAEEGDGPLPIIIPAVGEGGSADRPFTTEGDSYFENIYVCGLDNLGNLTKNLFRINEDGVTTTLKGCYLDYDSQSLFRMNADGLKLYIYDSILRNPALLADPGNGRVIDTRGNTMDEIFVQNTTMYSMTWNPLRSDGGLIHNLTFDHVTFYQSGTAGSGEIDLGESVVELERVVNATVTNNIFLDVGYEGHNISEGTPALRYPIIGIDSLNAPDVAAESERMYSIKDNMYGFTPEIEAFFDSHADLQGPVFINSKGQSLIDAFGWDITNNVEGIVEFTDGPGNAAIVAYAEYRYNDNYQNTDNPDPRADRNGRGAFADDPSTFGPAEDDYNFDYSTSSAAYTMAAGGFPLGDLNWFPDKKAVWELTGVDSDFEEAVVNDYSLEQNYPNPFNPSTTIKYALPKASKVTLAVYNIPGEKVAELVNREQSAGQHTVTWNAANLASGVYIYNLRADDVNLSKKMILMK